MGYPQASCSSIVIRMHHRRSRSHSGSRRRRRSSDRRKRSRSKDRHHKSSRSERRSARHSRSRSRSRDRRTRHHSRERRRRDSHRRRHSPSRDSRRHRHSSTGRRHRRHSRSPGHRSRHSDRKRSRSPRPSTSSKPEETSNPPATTTASVTGSNRPPVYKVTGVKFGRGRGTSTGTFKDKMREEYRHRVQEAEDVLAGRSQLPSLMSSQVTSSVATVSAGTGVMGSGGLSQTLINHVQVLQQSSQYLPGQPGCLTAEQKALNQKVILESTGRTKQQVEAAWGVKIPSIYNENTNNLAEIAQRTKKRSLLWKGSDKKKTEVNSTFNAVPILPGQSTSENLRFARLMGCMKGKPTGEEKAEEQPKLDTDAEEKAIIETQILNNNLEREFESSRRFTHIHRGCGLGYNNTLYQPH
ncbi:uncharacterized protein LOC143274830 isoform X2 [Babylonia areolata]|uniref:uncharacterized protein LOC143274830 isoform X2 n=1 Tax=Babylonia areolata TaxID=304850 RepID=UPI003FD42148